MPSTTTTLVLVLFIASTLAVTCPKQSYDKAVSLGDGISLFLPSNFSYPNNDANLFIQFRGIVPQRFSEGGVKAIVVACDTAGLSAAMQTKFGGASFVPNMIKQAFTIASQKAGKQIKLARLGLGSFSAGYAPLREHLNNKNVVSMVDSVIVIDGVHYGPVGNPTPVMMAPYAAYAKLAAANEKMMVISHSALKPTYCSSTDAANYLIKQVQGTRVSVPASEPSQYTYATRFGKVMKPESRSDVGSFHVEGYKGTQGNDHTEQVDNLGNLWNFYLAKRWNSC